MCAFPCSLRPVCWQERKAALQPQQELCGRLHRPGQQPSPEGPRGEEGEGGLRTDSQQVRQEIQGGNCRTWIRFFCIYSRSEWIHS